VPASSKSQVKTEVRLENLIPIIDVVGWHWQTTWWRALSNAGVGVGLMGTRETVNVPGKDPYTSAFLLGPQANFSFSGFRLGVSYLLHSEEGSPDHWYADMRNLRVLVGADLVRLFTGKDTALVRSDDPKAVAAGN
jgi:hypothetical protein